jgi:uncharacterized protein (DUF885 family)
MLPHRVPPATYVLFLLAVALAALLPVFLLPGCRTAPTGPSPEALALDSLYGAYRDHCLRSYPTWATYEGEHAYDDRLTDYGYQAFERRTAELSRFRAEAAAVDTTALDAGARLNRALFLREMDMALEAAAFHPEYVPFTQQDGPHLGFPQIIEVQPLATPDDYEAYFSRLASFPGQLAQCEELIKLGISTGQVPPRFVAEQVAAQCRTLGGYAMGASPFSEPLRASEEALGDDYPTLYTRLKELIEGQVNPAYLRLATVIEQDWVPVCRTEPGLHALPDGAARYAFAVRYHTTTRLTPDEIFAIGQAEVAAVQAEMEALAGELGHPGDLPGFIDRLRTDTAFYYTDPAALMDGYAALLDKAEAALPALFGRLPEAPCALKKIEPYRAANAPQAYYYPAPDDGSRPGYFYVNTGNLAARPKYTMTALTLHEAVPGHHLQIALAKELDGLPWFRRNLSATAFVEGWGLYAEALGYEMAPEEGGLYADPYQRFGALTFSMWRACRLVVDVGLHHKGWSREEAVAYMLARTPNSEADIRSEVDRYIAMPGQALAYKIGERRIRALRDEAEAALGERFDVRAFHDELLGAGPLPLELLERRVRAWIRAEGGPPS